MRKKLKGFTLVEMIIVVAIFSVIMFSAVQLLDPVSKFFVRSSQYEDTTACLDNIKRCVEGNLKYADRVRVYENFNPYSSATMDLPSAELEDNVHSFYDDFFRGRKVTDCYGDIYVLVFDNTVRTSDTDLSAIEVPADYASAQKNAGKITLFTYKMPRGSYSGTGDIHNWASVEKPTASSGSQPWYVNQALYGQCDYRFTLGDNNRAAGAAFSPQNFTINVTQTRIVRDKVNGGCVREPAATSSSTEYDVFGSMTCSFKMKNVLDAKDNYRTIGSDYKVLCGSGYNPSTNEFITGDENAPANYYAIEIAGGAGATTKGAIPRCQAIHSNAVPDLANFDGFYFIFTVPDTIYDLPDYVSLHGTPTTTT